MYMFQEADCILIKKLVVHASRSWLYMHQEAWQSRQYSGTPLLTDIVCSCKSVIQPAIAKPGNPKVLNACKVEAWLEDILQVHH